MLIYLLYMGIGAICTHIITWIYLALTNEEKVDIQSPVLLVTAHPDDESMFFGPTLLKLRQNHCVVDLLCFSDGNFDGLGSTRRSELHKAAKCLGLRNVEIIDSPSFPDGPIYDWPYEDIQRIVQETCFKHESKSVLTFDESGVSGHPNHCVLGQTLQRSWSMQLIPQLYCLKTIPRIRKFVFLLDAIVRNKSGESTMYSPLSMFTDVFRAMLAHHTQMVWFRWLYIIFSTYMIKNVLIKYPAYLK